MKLNGILGKGTGKLGSSVFAISGGEQVVREYNPVVSNPNTAAQVAQRAKLKLMSQLGAAFASVLAFKKLGLVSARNQFVSKNIGITTYSSEEATVDMTKLQLTPGSANIPGATVTAGAGGSSTVALVDAAADNISRVVYVVAHVDSENKVSIKSVNIATSAGAGRTFEQTVNVEENSDLILHYGIIDNNAQATANYDGYEASEENMEAVLAYVVNKSVTDYTFTVTKGNPV